MRILVGFANCVGTTAFDGVDSFLVNDGTLEVYMPFGDGARLAYAVAPGYWTTCIDDSLKGTDPA